MVRPLVDFGPPIKNNFGPGAPRQNTETPRSQGFSPLGFLGNLLGGVRDTVTGLSSVISGVGSDIINTGESALHGQLPHNLFTPHFLASLPGNLLTDYATRYNPAHLAGNLYHDPLSYIFDLALGGDLAVRGAEAAAARGADSALIDSILPSKTQVLQSPAFYNEPKVFEVADARNPFKRVLISGARKAGQGVGGLIPGYEPSLLTAPIENLNQQIGALQSLGTDISAPQANELARLERAAKTAADSGAMVYQTPEAALGQVKRAVIKMRAQHIASFNLKRDTALRELTDIMKPLAKTPDKLNHFDQILMGINDGGMHQWSPEELIGQLQNKGFRDFADAQRAVIMGDPRVASLGYDEVAALRRSIIDPLQNTAIRDATGKPLRVFSGTPTVFDQFDPAKANPNSLFGPGAAYATDHPGVASTYAGEPLTYAGEVPPNASSVVRETYAKMATHAPNVRPFYLNITNPFMGDEPLTHEAASAIAAVVPEAADMIMKEVGQPGVIAYTRLADKFGQRIGKAGDKYSRFESNKAMANEVLKQAGFDGIEYAGGTRVGNDLHRAFVAFSPDQIVPFHYSADINPGYERWARPLHDAGNASMPLQAVQPTTDPAALYTAAQNNARTLTDGLRSVFGNSVQRASLKPMDRLMSKIATYGTANDALRATVTTPWRDLDSYLTMLRQKMDVVGVEDSRALPLNTELPNGGEFTSGYRGVTATVRMPDQTLAEVDFGSPEWQATRDAMGTAQQQLEAHVAEQADLNNTLVTQPEVGAVTQRRIEFLDRQISAMSRSIQGRWSHVTDEIASEGLGHALPGGEARQILGKVDRWVWQHATKPLIDTGVFDAAGAFERSYAPIRQALGARWDPSAGLGGDFVDGPTAEEVHAKWMAEDKPMPTYYPLMPGEEVAGRPGPSQMDFLSRSNLQGGLRSAMKPGFMKTYRGKLLMEDAYLKDASSALARRAISGLRLRDTVDFYKKFIETYGRPLLPGEGINPGEMIAYPMGTLNYMSTKLGLTDELMSKIMDAGQLTDQQVADIMSSSIVDHQRRVVAITRQGVQAYAVPKEAARQFMKQVIVPHMENGFRLFWDTPNKMWRSMVLTARPAWVANNILGSAIFTKMQGGSLWRVIRQMEPGFRQAMKEIVPVEFQGEINAGLFTSEGPENAGVHLGAAADTRTGKVYDAISHSFQSNRAYKRISTMGASLRHLNQEVEGAFRREAFLTAAEKAKAVENTMGGAKRFMTSLETLKQIASKGIDEASARKAVDEVAYFHNDYGALGPIERHYIRRFMIPFYSFYKHVTVLALKYPFDYPLRNYVMTQLAQLTNDMNREKYGAMPTWLRGGAPIGPVIPGKDTSWFLGGSINPFSTLTSFTDGSFLQLAYPLPKVAAEMEFGQSVIGGKDFTDANVIAPFGLGQYRRLNDGTMVPVDKVQQGPIEALLQNIPVYSLAEQIAAGGPSYDTSGLPGILFDRLTGKDPRAQGLTGQPLSTNVLDALGGYLLGVRGHPYDLTNYQGRTNTDSLKAASAFLRSRGAPLPSTGDLVGLATQSQARNPVPPLVEF